jgi:hypothetical protein
MSGHKGQVGEGVGFCGSGACLVSSVVEKAFADAQHARLGVRLTAGWRLRAVLLLQEWCQKRKSVCNKERADAGRPAIDMLSSDMCAQN